MRMIAFAYAAAAEGTEPMYRGLIDGMIKSARKTMPECEILHLADENTAPISGTDKILRIDRDMPLMVWRMKAHQLAHAIADEILFVEPDVRFLSSVMDLFDYGMDVVLATRDCDADWGEEKLGEITPYTMGTTASRSADFWRKAKLHCQTLSEREQYWIGDMIGIKHAVDSGEFKIKIVQGGVYNHIPNSIDDIGIAKALHYKGKRKMWLFPNVSEGLDEAA